MLLSIFHTIEFYVITAFLAAAVVGFAAMPSRRGAARTFLFAGTLSTEDDGASEPHIAVTVGTDGSVTLCRSGLREVATDGAYSLAVTLIELDATIEERLVAGKNLASASGASVKMDCFGAERYHFHFKSEATGRSAAFSLNIRPGNRIERVLS